ISYTNPRGLSLTDQGSLCATLMAYTLADYSAAGTYAGAAADVVTLSTTGNQYVKLAPDNQAKLIGRVASVALAAAATAVGYLVVEWLDIERFVVVDCDDMSTMTLGNAAIKDGNTTVYNNFDAGATTGILIVVAKSGT